MANETVPTKAKVARELSDLIKDGKVTNLIIMAELKDGQVFTGFSTDSFKSECHLLECGRVESAMSRGL